MIKKCRWCKKDFKVRESWGKRRGFYCGFNCRSEEKENLSKKRFYKNFDKKKSGCWEWKNWLNKGGYGQFKVRGKRYPASRFSYLIHKGEISAGLFVCHSCDNPKCVNPEHLWLGTALENAQDRDKKGRHLPPDFSNTDWKNTKRKRKFTEEQIKEIRDRYIFRKTSSELCKEFKIRDSTLNQIVRRKIYKWVL